MPLCADACGIDFRQSGQRIGSGQHIIGAGGKGILHLVGDCRVHTARAKGIDDKGREPQFGDRFGVCKMGDGNAQTAGHDDHHRQFFVLRRGRGQEQLAIYGDTLHRRMIADHLMEIDRISAVERYGPAHAGICKAYVLIFETGGLVRRVHQCFPVRCYGSNPSIFAAMACVSSVCVETMRAWPFSSKKNTALE